jgi:hypothetical protein
MVDVRWRMSDGGCPMGRRGLDDDDDDDDDDDNT